MDGRVVVVVVDVEDPSGTVLVIIEDNGAP
jgi:hypothetical protein